MRNKKMPTSKTLSKQKGSGSRRQYVYDPAPGNNGGKKQVVTHHQADKMHKNPHWHAADARVNKNTKELVMNNHGQHKYEKAGNKTSQYTSGACK